MEPLSEIAGLQRAVASGLTEDLARVHGSSTKNLQATLQTCQDHLSASVDCASRVQKASIAIGDSLSTGNRTASLRASLQEALKVEEQTKQKLQGLESVSDMCHRNVSSFGRIL